MNHPFHSPTGTRFQSFSALALLLCLLALPSCVALFSKAKQSVKITSQMPDAKLSMAGNPVTTANVQVPKVPGVMEFNVQKEGYLDRHYTISSSKANPLRYLNVLWVPTLVGLVLAPLDLWNPKVYQYKSRYIIPKNEPAPSPRQESEKYIFVKENSFEMAKNAVVLRKFTYENKYLAKVPDDEKRYVEADQQLFNTDDVERFQMEFLHTFRFRDTTQRIFPSYGNSLYLNTRVKGLVYNKVNPRLFLTKQELSSPKVNADLQVAYEILDFYGQILLSREYSVTSDFFAYDHGKLNPLLGMDSIGSGYARALQNGLAISLSRFMQSPEFRALLPKTEEKVQNEPLEIARPAAVTSRLNDLIKAAVTIQNGPWHGSGFLVTESGFIVTNLHVVSKGDRGKLTVILNDGSVFPATIVRYSEKSDLALLKIEASGLPFMALQDNGQEPEIGSPISTIGTPNSVELGQSVAKGIVSGFRVGNGISYIQTDISLNGGNSGGAFISKEGYVIGIAALKLVGEDVNGIGFGIPVSHVFSDLGLRYK